MASKLIDYAKEWACANLFSASISAEGSCKSYSTHSSNHYPIFKSNVSDLNCSNANAKGMSAHASLVILDFPLNYLLSFKVDYV